MYTLRRCAAPARPTRLHLPPTRRPPLRRLDPEQGQVDATIPVRPGLGDWLLPPAHFDVGVLRHLRARRVPLHAAQRRSISAGIGGFWRRGAGGRPPPPCPRPAGARKPAPPAVPWWRGRPEPGLSPPPRAGWISGPQPPPLLT